MQIYIFSELAKIMHIFSIIDVSKFDWAKKNKVKNMHLKFNIHPWMSHFKAQGKDCYLTRNIRIMYVDRAA